jgi:hypothetical protein
MPDERSARRERLWAVATFAGIGLATVAALDFLVTGGFDFGAQRTTSTYADPLTAVAAPAPASAVTALAWSDPAIADPVEPALADDALPVEELIEGSADEPAHDIDAPSEDELYREITRLYAEQDERAAQAAEEEAQALQDAEEDEAPLYDERDLNPDPSAPDSEF